MNLKEEILTALKENEYTIHDILCAEIYNDYCFNKNGREEVLEINIGTDVNDKKKLLNKISNYNYHAGYGSQVLFGFIWMKDGTWFSRGEYDGSEWFEHNKCPDIPNNLMR